MIDIGDIVVDLKYGEMGIVTKAYANWDDLKANNIFSTIDPDNDSEKMSDIEKLINGDPKDEWLKAQEIPFTESELKERWFDVKLFGGGGIWICESHLKKTEFPAPFSIEFLSFILVYSLRYLTKEQQVHLIESLQERM